MGRGNGIADAEQPAERYVPLSPDQTAILLRYRCMETNFLRREQWTFQDGESSVKRLDGLEPEFANWHAKFTLCKVQYMIHHYIYYINQ